MDITLDNVESVEWFFIYLFLYYIVAVLVWHVGKWLNQAVIRANGGTMPVVDNRPDDREYFGKIIESSERHDWADENTKLMFLTDWINTRPWKNCPYGLALWIASWTKYNIFERQKISIGDILLWTAMCMGMLAIIALFALTAFLLVYVVVSLL